MRYRFTAVFLATVWMAGPEISAEVREVRIPAPESARDTRNEFFIRTLDLALRRSFADQPGGYRLRRVDMSMDVQSRGIRALESGREIDVLWTMTTREREERLLPIRVPLMKGLLGWRMLLIRAEDQHRFDGLKSLEELRQFVAGQGENWPDVAVLEGHDLPVITGRSYDGLFRMLRKRRFDYFPRAITEIYDEYLAHRDSGIAIEDHLLLHYPAAIYFFVNRKDERLAAHIEEGLRAAIRDGSFDRLFMDMYGDLLQKAHVGKRTVLRLENPLLPGSVPLGEKELWLELPRE